MASGTQTCYSWVLRDVSFALDPGDLCGKSGTDYRCPEGTCDYDAGLRFHMCCWYVFGMCWFCYCMVHDMQPFVTDTIEFAYLVCKLQMGQFSATGIDASWVLLHVSFAK